MFTDGTATIGLALAALSMLHHSLHLLARWQRAISIATLARMHQRLDAALDTETTRVTRVLSGSCSLVVALIIKTQSKFLHLMFMALGVVAGDAKIIILQKEGKKIFKNVVFYPTSNPTMQYFLKHLY